MRILYYDCFSGISGDMNLGALTDLGVDPDFLRSELNKLNLEGWKLETEKAQRHGISGTKVTVKLTRKEHSHRHLSEINKIIDSSQLDEKTKQLSKRIFRRIAEAEGKVHGIPAEKVHFHEVGAVDSIIDITGAAICLNALNIDEVHVSAIELGGGMVKCDHGLLPVPAPATAEILKGIPVRKDGVDFEATTPTGAAIIAETAGRFNESVPLKILKTGYGVGHKDHPAVPNLLRVFLCEPAGNQETGHEAVLLECNIDDMNPEFYEYITGRLFEAGASDVYLTSVMMKKGRPGTVLSVIAEKGLAGVLTGILFTESTTLGIRSFPFMKETLSREFHEYETPFGKVKFKHSFYRGKEVSVKPESEDCKRIAGETGRPLREIYNILLETVRSKKVKNE